ncbi:hypothetical protein BGX31_006884 [Mortierella sp. GBA43]|nr:hypothetical protein BGX31_006884 [Mortierella sp. GBA43]
MRFSLSVPVVTLSSLAFLATSRFSNNNNGASLVSATLTAEERLQVEAKDPNNPNYCPACLAKAMNNHFPHACAPNHDPLLATTRPEGPLPHERRCVCVAFMDFNWMKEDCFKECPFVHDSDSWEFILPAEDIPGCEDWIDFEAKQERIVEGFEKRNPDHKPEVYPKDEETKDTDDVESSQQQVKEQEEHVDGARSEATEDREKSSQKVETDKEAKEHTKDEL